jgi:transcriptional regulator GlxA family with amidase domain
MAAERWRKRQIAVVVYLGVSALELVGTVSVLGGLGLKTGFRTVTVAGDRELVDANTPMKLVPESTFEDVSQPFGILIPGGGPSTIRAMGDENILRYVRSAAEGAQLVASVGTGALILAAAGLLDDRQATTHPAYHGILENLGATYVERHWTSDGEFVTSGGTSGGVDMGLYLAARLTDEASARQAQLWLDYDPHPPFGRPDYDDMGLPLRAGRAWVSLTAPLLTARPRRLTRRAIQTGGRR